MKSTLRCFLTAVVLQAPLAAAVDVECRGTYSHAVGACAQPSALPDPALRAGGHTACVDGARLTRSYCMTGIDACLDDGEAAYERSVAACGATFDLVVCRGGPTCEDTLLHQRANCIHSAVRALAFGAVACAR